MKPALTAGEWDTFLKRLPPHTTHTPREIAHSRAARELYGRPFGFGPEDVLFCLASGDAVRQRMKDTRDDETREAMGVLAGVADSLGERIAALLPPRELSGVLDPTSGALLAALGLATK